MKQQLFKKVLGKTFFLHDPQDRLCSVRTLFLALLMSLGISSTWADDVATVTFNGTTTNYSTFADAIDYANSLSTTDGTEAAITLLNDCCGNLSVKEGQYITITGGTHTLTLSEPAIINGSLAILNGTYEASDYQSDYFIKTANANSSLIIRQGTIDATTNSNTKYAIYVGPGTCTINGGIIKGNDHGLYANTAQINLNGGTFYGNSSISSYSQFLAPVSTFIVEGKRYYVRKGNSWMLYAIESESSTPYPIFVGGKTDVASVTANGNDMIFDSFGGAVTAAHDADEATITMLSDCTAGTVNFQKGKNITLSGGSHTLTMSTHMIVGGNLTIKDGTYVSTYDGTYCINVDNSGSLTLNGGTFTGTNGSIKVTNGKPVLSVLAAGKTFFNEDGTTAYTGDVSTAYTVNSTVKVGDCTEVYTRVVTSGNYGSICLPRASNLWNGVDKVYKVTDVSASSVTLEEVTTMLAGTPYIFKSNTTALSFNKIGCEVESPVADDYLVGNFESANVPAGNYILQKNQFCKVDADNTIISGSYRCYLNGAKVPSAAKIATLNIDSGEDDMPNAIEEVINSSNGSNSAIYDINGRRLQSLQKGINIINGKKIIVK